jgi:HlyD family secretion protein
MAEMEVEMHNRRIVFPILIILIILTAGGWFIWQQAQPQVVTQLQGSGSVEAVEVIISPEIGGRVVEVMVVEGQAVQAGDALFRLDGALLEAQRNQAVTVLAAAQAGLEVADSGLTVAQAAVDTAQAQYNLEYNLALALAQPARASAWSQTTPSEFTLPTWYFTTAEEFTAAQAEVEAAHTNLESKQSDLEVLTADPAYAGILDAETRLAEAQADFLVVKDILDRSNLQSEITLRDAAAAAYDITLSELEAAQQVYADLLNTENSANLMDARASLAVAQERYDTALDRYNFQLTGEYSLRVQAAEDSVAQAEANVTLAEAKLTQAQTAIAQAQAQLDLLDVQMSKLLINAAVSGVVLSRNIEPGEVLQPGAVALILAQLDRLTITVYIPEDRYGEISLGAVAQVRIDSFPGQTFMATVTRIADQAEFTPRNVATAAGRRTTVFAVQLAVNDTAGQLKPGMPATVVFDR